MQKIDFKGYTGSKSGNGVLQFLINLIPPHKRYFELYAGSAKLYYAKKPAEISVLTPGKAPLIPPSFIPAQAFVRLTRYKLHSKHRNNLVNLTTHTMPLLRSCDSTTHTVSGSELRFNFLQ